MDELKPCPFCGGEGTMVSRVDKVLILSGKCWFIQCKKCGSQGAECYEHLAAPEKEYKAINQAWKDAIEAWNRRVKE